MADVFISYHMKSAGEIVRQIAAELENVGVSYWYAEQEAQNDPTFYADTVPPQIRACKVFLLVLNEGSNQSWHVKNEVSLAFQRIANNESITMKCFKVDNCTLSSHMAYYLARVQRTENNPPDQEHMRKLAEQIADSLRGLPTWKMIHEQEQELKELKQMRLKYRVALRLLSLMLWAGFLELLAELPDFLENLASEDKQELSELKAALNQPLKQAMEIAEKIDSMMTDFQNLPLSMYDNRMQKLADFENWLIEQTEQLPLNELLDWHDFDVSPILEWVEEEPQP